MEQAESNPHETKGGAAAVHTVLLTGATGFVGQHLFPALAAAGYRVRCATRDVDRARREHPDREWVQLDVERPETLASALDGCDAAYFLVHGMAKSTGDYPEREQRSAETFATAAERAGLRRLVYLGGVIPKGTASSRHLRSRERTGEVLRAGRVSTIELRAAMVIGAGSTSWTMVRDLAARLPAMLLPRWLRNASYPIFIDDVVTALLAALELPQAGSQCFELPGPERVTHREVLVRTAAALGHHRVMLSVPVLSPRLSSYWIGLVTRVDLAMARELVEGVRYDLEPSGPSLWEVLDHAPVPLDTAIRLALDDERAKARPSRSALTRLVTIGRDSEHAHRVGAALH